MPCEKQTTKKYLSRKSPPYSAMDCKGKTMDGKDGKYISMPDKNKVYRWTKVGSTKGTQKNLDIPKPKHKYTIEDNGTHPYQVYDYGSRADIYAFKYDKDTDKDIMQKKILSIPYKKIFPGDNALRLKDYPSVKGNTVLLLQKNGKYIYVGAGIFEFETKDGDVIDKYYSPVGNSDVPYPYAVGQKNSYFLIEKQYVENKNLDLKKDGYTQLYGFPEKRGDSPNPVPAKSLRMKILFKRFALYH
uniref:Uncharacterized protein n=1 Tax=viral metagenome TaxID=1070528 RepID=A0A6C0L8T8_9ZZZZ